jgi:hypothetical protein
MLQNREVAGATMGAGRSRAMPAVFGPYGYLNLVVPVVLVVLIFAGVALGWKDHLGLHWAWLGLAFVLTASLMSRFTASRAGDTDARYRAGPRDVTFWTQRLAPWVVLAVLAAGFVAHFAGLGVLGAALTAFACGLTAGVAPVFLRRAPAEALGQGPALREERVPDPRGR